MAKPMTVLEFDEDEKETLKSVYDTRRFNAVVKPIADSLRDMAEEIKAIGSAENVRSEDVSIAKGRLDEIQRIVEGLPDSEAKDGLAQDIVAAQEVMEAALSLG